MRLDHGGASDAEQPSEDITTFVKQQLMVWLSMITARGLEALILFRRFRFDRYYNHYRSYPPCALRCLPFRLHLLNLPR